MAALIVTAELGAADQAWLDCQRRLYFPPDRNRLPAHLTMFHAVPPSAEAEARSLLSTISAQEPPPPATVAGLMNLGGGVAYRIVSVGLDRIRDELAAAFHGLLSAQDSGGWRPHVTIQNKVPASAARALLAELEHDFAPRPLAIRGLGLHRYLGGPWEMVAVYPFRGRP